MNVAPKIGKRDLEEELARIHRVAHRTRTTVLFASGEAGEVSAEIDGQRMAFRVLAARCEIELREHLANVNGSPTVILVDYDDRLPLDVQGRVAGGRVLFVSRKERLARLFGAKEVAPGLQASPLAAELLSQPDARYSHISGAVIDLDTAWRAWLQTHCGLPASGDLFAERLLEFCAGSASGPSFVQRFSSKPELRSALHEWIKQTTGSIGLAAWIAWEAGAGRHAAALTFILEVAARHLSSNGYLLARVDSLMERYPHIRQEVQTRRFSLLTEWGGLAAPLALRLSATGLLEAVLKDADDMLPAAPELDPVLRDSSRLRRGFELCRLELAAALQRGLSSRSSDAFEAAVLAFEKVRQHRLASLQPRLIERARMAVRLLGYRVSRPDFSAKAKGGPPYEEMVLLAEHFAEQGGFVDLARREARGAASADPLEEAIRLVIDDIDRLGDEDDRRFALGLANWLMAGRKTDRLVPLDLAIDRFGAAFLESRSDRKLLIVLLDGMSWANAVELLEDLDGHHRVSPIRWRPKGAAGTIAGALPPMMAALPTVTEVSRSALFAGHLLGQSDRPDTSKDPSRFADHKGLNKIGVTSPKLLLKSDVQAGSGHAAEKALALVRSDDRVVAVVVNAIDDQLKGTNAVKVEYVLEKILPLFDLVKAARESRRVMLLVSDHGHATSTRMSQVGTRGEDGHARYRDLPEDASPAEYELALGGEFVRRSKGKGKVAMLYRETDRYCASGQVGEHGGASRAEVVAPAILVADVDLAAQLAEEDRADPDLEPVHFARPEWWDLRFSNVRSAVIDMAELHEPPRMEAKGNGTLFPVAAKPTVVPPAESSKWRTLLLEAPVFKDLSKEKRKKLETEVIPRVVALAEEDGRLPIEAFARKIGLRKDRVAGVVAVLGEWLHIDGYEVVRIDQVADQVILDLTLLEDLFRSST